MLTDFEPVARLPSNPYVVVARKDLPAADLKELIAWLKANPAKATQGTAGPGSGQHVSGVYFQNVTGTSFQFVPYRAGSSEIMRDLVAGHIDLTFDQAITALPHVRAKNVKAYAVTSDKRLGAAPDIPTVDEAGAPGVYISTWYGLWVPKGTPPEAIQKLTTAAMDALADPDVRARLATLGQEIPPPEQQTAEALAAHHKAEIEKWWPLIKAANIKVGGATRGSHHPQRPSRRPRRPTAPMDIGIGKRPHRRHRARPGGRRARSTTPRGGSPAPA